MVKSRPFFIAFISILSIYKSYCQTLSENLSKALKATQNLEVHKSNNILASEKVSEIKLLLENYNDILLLLIDEDPEKLSFYEKKAEARMEMLEKISNKSKPEYLLVKSEMKFQWALVNYKYANELSASWKLQQAHSHISENRKKFPQYVPNLKTLGFFHIIIGSLPEKYKWVLDKLGFNGDVELGYEELKKCAETENIFQFESNLLLNFIDAYIFDKQEKTIKNIKKLEEVYPENLSINFLYTTILTNNNKAEEAKKIIESRVQNEGHPRFDFYHYKLANIYFQKSDYQNSIKEFKIFLKDYKGKNYVKGAYHKLSLCHYFLGNSNEQKLYFENINKYGWALTDEDKYAQKFYDIGKFPNKNLAKIRYLTDGGYFDEAIEIINQTDIDDFEDEKLKAEFYYRRARIYDLKNEKNRALELYIKTIFFCDKNNISNLYFAPNSCLKAGYIYIAQGKNTQAKEILKKAIAYKNHEYENSIELKAKTLLKNLEN